MPERESETGQIINQPGIKRKGPVKTGINKPRTEAGKGWGRDRRCGRRGRISGTLRGRGLENTKDAGLGKGTLLCDDGGQFQLRWKEGAYSEKNSCGRNVKGGDRGSKKKKEEEKKRRKGRVVVGDPMEKKADWV